MPQGNCGSQGERGKPREVAVSKVLIPRGSGVTVTPQLHPLDRAQIQVAVHRSRSSMSLLKATLAVTGNAGVCRGTWESACLTGSPEEVNSETETGTGPWERGLFSAMPETPKGGRRAPSTLPHRLRLWAAEGRWPAPALLASLGRGPDR